MNALPPDVVVDDFSHVDFSGLFLPMFTVCSSPRDYPGRYTVRLSDLDKPTNIVAVRDTLEAARACVPKGLARLIRDPNDDPVIVEVYV